MTEEDYLPPEHGDNRGRISFDGEERSKRVGEGNILSLCLYASASPSAPSVSAIGPHVEELGDIFTWVQSVPVYNAQGSTTRGRPSPKIDPNCPQSESKARMRMMGVIAVL